MNQFQSVQLSSECLMTLNGFNVLHVFFKNLFKLRFYLQEAAKRWTSSNKSYRFDALNLMTIATEAIRNGRQTRHALFASF